MGNYPFLSTYLQKSHVAVPVVSKKREEHLVDLAGAWYVPYPWSRVACYIGSDKVKQTPCGLVVKAKI